jgi:hypothetical protein
VHTFSSSRTALPKTYADWQASLDKLDLPVKILTDGLVETSGRLQVEVQVEGRPAFFECYFEVPNSFNKTLDDLLRPTIDGRDICLDFIYGSKGLAPSLALTAALMADYGALCYVDFASHGFVDIEEVLRDFRANPHDEPPPERLGPVNPEKQKRVDDALEAVKASLEVLQQCNHTNQESQNQEKLSQKTVSNSQSSPNHIHRHPFNNCYQSFVLLAKSTLIKNASRHMDLCNEGSKNLEPRESPRRTGKT